jgi:hypothetical protein
MRVKRWIVEVAGGLGDLKGKMFYVTIGTGLSEDIAMAHIFTKEKLAIAKKDTFSPKWYKSAAVMPVWVDFTCCDHRMDRSHDHNEGPQ